MHFLKKEKQRESLGEQMIVSRVVKATVVLYWINPLCHFNYSSCTNSVTSSVIAKVKATKCHASCDEFIFGTSFFPNLLYDHAPLVPSTYSMETRCSILWIRVINFRKVGCFRGVQENCSLQTGLKSPHF